MVKIKREWLTWILEPNLYESLSMRRVTVKMHWIFVFAIYSVSAINFERVLI